MNIPLNHSGYSNTDFYGVPPVLDMTFGVNFGLFNTSYLTAAYILPVTGPQPFSGEFALQFNFLFGRSRREAPAADPADHRRLRTFPRLTERRRSRPRANSALGCTWPAVATLVLLAVSWPVLATLVFFAVWWPSAATLVFFGGTWTWDRVTCRLARAFGVPLPARTGRDACTTTGRRRRVPWQDLSLIGVARRGSEIVGL